MSEATYPSCLRKRLRDTVYNPWGWFSQLAGLKHPPLCGNTGSFFPRRLWQNHVDGMLMACWWQSSFSPLEFAHITSQTHLNKIKVSCKHHPIFKAFESPATSCYIHLPFDMPQNHPSFWALSKSYSDLVAGPLLVGQVGSFGRSAAEVQRPGGGCGAGRACRGRARGGGGGGGGAGACGGADHGDGGRTCQLRLGCDVDQKRVGATGGMSIGRVLWCSIAQVPVVFRWSFMGLIVWVPHAGVAQWDFGG